MSEKATKSKGKNMPEPFVWADDEVKLLFCNIRIQSRKVV
jgi:hypothetical protein